MHYKVSFFTRTSDFNGQLKRNRHASLSVVLIAMIIVVVVLSVSILGIIRLQHSAPPPPVSQSGSNVTNTFTVIAIGNSSIPGTPNYSYPWRSLGPAGFLNPQNVSNSPTQISSGHVGDGIAVYYSNPNIMYLELGIGPGYIGPSSTGGVYKTTNGGLTWTPEDFGLPFSVGDSILMNQSNPDQLLVALWNGVYRTDDGGGYWYKVSGIQGVTNLVMVNGIVFAASSEGVIKSADLGLHWNVIYTANWVVSISVSQNTIYSLQSPAPAAYLLMKSTDLGQTWTETYNFSNISDNLWSVRASPQNPNIVYVAIGEKSGINYSSYVSVNGGYAFKPVTNLPHTAGIPPRNVIGISEYTFDPSNSSKLWVAGGAYEARSTNGGTTFVPGPQGTDNRAIVVDPFNDSILWLGSDQGIYISKDGGLTWISLNGNLSDVLSEGISVGNDGNLILLDMQDYSALITHNGGIKWVGGNEPPIPLVVEGTIVYVNPYNNSWVYGIQYGGSYRYLQVSNDSAYTFYYKSTTGPSNYLMPNGIIAADPFARSEVYASGANGTLISRDSGKTWRLLAGSPGNVTSFGFLSSTSMLVGTPNGVMYSSGGGWQRSNGIFGFVTSIAVDPHNTSDVFASSSYFSSGLIYKSTDSGRTFALINTTLAPRYNVDPWNTVSVFVLNESGYPIIAITDYGAYLSNNNGNTWIPISYNMHAGDVTGLSFTSGNLYVSTWGGGVMEFPNFSIESLPATLEGDLPNGNYTIKINGSSIPVFGSHFKYFLTAGKYSLTVYPSVGGAEQIIVTLAPGGIYDVRFSS